MKYAAQFKTLQVAGITAKDVLIHFETSPQNMVQLVRAKSLDDVRDMNLRDQIFVHIRIGEIRSKTINLVGFEIKEQLDGPETVAIMQSFFELFGPLVDEIAQQVAEQGIEQAKKEVDDFFGKINSLSMNNHNGFGNGQHNTKPEEDGFDEFVEEAKRRGRRLVNRVRDLLAI